MDGGGQVPQAARAGTSLAGERAVVAQSQWVAQPDFGRQIGIEAACWLSVLDLRRRLAASQKSDLSRDAGLNQSLE
jgi:hypothetical protein